MSLKNDERGKSWSISARLVFLYAASAFAMLALSGFFFDWISSQGLNHQSLSFLKDQASLLRGILGENPEDAEDLEEAVQWEGSAPRFMEYYARILDGSGKAVLETDGVPVSSGDFPKPRAERAETLARLRRGKRSYLLLTAWAELGGSKEKRLLQLVLDVTPQVVLLAGMRNKILLFLVFGVFVSAGMGILMTRKGLAPLEKMAESAENITANRLHERIQGAKWPRELALLAAAFDEMLERLEKSFSRLSQFSADLAHELRTPINNLMGEAGVALTKSRTSEEYKQVLESSLEEYARLSKIIDSLLFLARAENTEISLKRSWVEAAKEVAAVKAFHEAVTAERELEIASSGSAMVYADPALLRRVLTNVISNAVQYTADRGKIWVEIREFKDKGVSITVRDNGIGISPDMLPHIFERFRRADPARVHHPEGAGLGLAIVKSIMELHGGSVTAESSGGTSVTLIFPPG